MPKPTQERGVHTVSVTVELVGTEVQNLRLYERRGLLEPSSTTTTDENETEA